MIRSPLRSPLNPVLSAVGNRSRPTGINRALSSPIGFDWTPPVSVYRSPAGVYYTDYVKTPFLTEGAAGVTTIYLDGQLGSDSNPGTSALPKKSLVAASAGRVGSLLLKARGIFYNGITSPVQTAHDNLCVEAWGGAELIITTEGFGAASLVWTDETAGIWSAPASFASFNGASVYVGTDVETLQKYPVVGSLALCQSTPGSHYRQTTPSLRHFVHTLTGESPATGHTIYASNGAAQSFQSAGREYDQRIGFYGVSFRGGETAFRVLGNSTFGKRIDFVGCSFKHGSTFGALHATGTADVITCECVAGPSDFDGFAYHTATGAATGAVPNAFEIDNIGRYNGLISAANQGSTTHYGGKVVRVNCSYYSNANDQVADVGEGTRSWNLGCTFGPDGIGVGFAGVQAGNNGADTKMWLDGCIFDGVEYGVGAAVGATIYYKNMAAPSATPTSTGTVVPY